MIPCSREKLHNLLYYHIIRANHYLLLYVLTCRCVLGWLAYMYMYAPQPTIHHFIIMISSRTRRLGGWAFETVFLTDTRIPENLHLGKYPALHGGRYLLERKGHM